MLTRRWNSELVWLFYFTESILHLSCTTHTNTRKRVDLLDDRLRIAKRMPHGTWTKLSGTAASPRALFRLCFRRLRLPLPLLLLLLRCTGGRRQRAIAICSATDQQPETRNYSWKHHRSRMHSQPWHASDELLHQCPLDCVRDDEPGPMRLASVQATWSDYVAPSTCAGCFGRPGERFPLTPAHTSPARIMDLELAHGHRPRHA